MSPKKKSRSSPLKSKRSAEKPSFQIKETCPSFRRGHVPPEEDVQRLRTLSEPHVTSFDFFLEKGLPRAIRDIVASELDIVDPKANDVDLDSVETVQFWVENVSVKAPTKSEATKGGLGSRLSPRECRELGLMYSGPITGDFCFQVIQRRNGSKIKGRVTKIQKTFGNMPIMVMSKACHLRGKTPTQLASMREEVRIQPLLTCLVAVSDRPKAQRVRGVLLGEWDRTVCPIAADPSTKSPHGHSKV